MTLLMYIAMAEYNLKGKLEATVGSPQRMYRADKPRSVLPLSTAEWNLYVNCEEQWMHQE